MLIVWKKAPYLKKLSVEGGENNYVFLENMFPGASAYIKRVDLSAHKRIWMQEFEKLVRRLHIVSLKLDNFTNSLLHKIRTKNGEFQDKTIKKVEFKDLAEGAGEQIRESSLDIWKKEEQRLIVEIAKDPKNAELYKKLGDIYVKMNNLKDAEESLRVALDLNPHDQEVRTKLERISRHLGF